MLCERLKDLYHLIDDFNPFVDWLSPNMCFFFQKAKTHMKRGISTRFALFSVKELQYYLRFITSTPQCIQLSNLTLLYVALLKILLFLNERRKDKPFKRKRNIVTGVPNVSFY